MYCIYDDFNGCVVSRHRTLEGLANGTRKFWRMFYANNSASSYIPLSYREWNGDEWIRLDDFTIERIERMLQE